MSVRPVTLEAREEFPQPPEAVAVVGLAGRFPGAPDVESLWRLVEEGAEGTTRWDRETLAAAGVDAATLDHPDFVPVKGVIENPADFDAEFFGISPREAEILDPQVRLFLETCWQAAEDGGFDLTAFADQGRAGVYGGSNLSSYLLSNLLARPDVLAQAGELQVRISNDKDALATWVAYKLDLRGPCVTVQTACSTSLVAIHLACQGLLDGECDLALAGGSALSFPWQRGYVYQEGGILSPDGRCRPFDREAAGTVPATGVGVVALRRLSDALEDGDPIRAVIRATAVGNDGAQKAGYTAPGVEGQLRAIAEALSLAEVEADTIRYVETHGSGTKLGDPIEIEALSRAFAGHTDRRGFCALGSAKANLGHLDSAAGVTGLIKTVCALEAATIPPLAGFSSPSPALALDESPFVVPTEARPWPGDGPRRAGVSSFGIGGTNAHAVLEEAPESPPTVEMPRWRVVPLSARTATAVDAMSRRLADHLEAEPAVSLAQVAHTLAVGRRPFDHRRAVVVHDSAEGAGDLESLVTALGGSTIEGVATPEATDRGLAFLFPGLGDHWPGMGRELYDADWADGPTVYRQVVDECAEILRRRGLDLLSVLMPEESTTRDDGTAPAVPDLRRMLERSEAPRSEAERRLDATRMAHPAIFVVELALARQLMAWGLRPTAMAGYSLGEVVAACLAEVISVEDAVVLVAERAERIEALPEGAMLAVPLAVAAVEPFFEGHEGLAISAHNGDGMTVVGGSPEAIEALAERLEAEGVACRQLRSRHAFHTSAMAPAAEALAKHLASVPLAAPKIPYLSNVTGTWITDAEATDPALWARHLVEPVRFSDALGELLAVDGPALLEVGPGRTLTTLARQHPSCGPGRSIRATLGDRRDGKGAEQALVTALASLWVEGHPVDWREFTAGESPRRVPLPTYPFERRRFWIESGDGATAPIEGSTTQEGKTADLGDWFYLPTWRRGAPLRRVSPTASAVSPPVEGPVLVLDDGGDRIVTLATALAETEVEVVRVEVGEIFSTSEEGGGYTVEPGSREDWGRLVAELAQAERLPRTVIHGWSLVEAPVGDGEWSPEILASVLDRGFYSLLFLTQALAEHPNPGCRLMVLARQLWDVLGGERLCPPKAALLGPVEVLPQETPWLDVRCIDVGTMEDSGGPTGLLAELGETDSRVAMRRGRRWLPSVEPQRIESPPRPVERLVRRGTYLVTSADATGLAVAEHLARSREARLAILATAESDARLSSRLDALESQATELSRWTVDPADFESVERGVKEACAHLLRDGGELTGVFHTASVPDAGLAQLKTRQDAEPVLAPKVATSLALLRGLVATPPSLLVLYGASASHLGGVGQVDHCAANAVLGALAEDLTSAGTVTSAGASQASPSLPASTLVLEWDTFVWEGESQGEGLSDALARQLAENLERFGIDAEEHAELLDRALATELPRWIVSGRRFPEVMATSEAAKSVSLFDQVADGTLAPSHRRPDLAVAFRAPTSDTEKTLAQLWREAFGIDRVGVDDDFFDLEGNSLMAVQIVTRLRSALSVEVPMGVLFEAPTIAQLAERVDALRPQGDTPDGDLSALLGEIEALSPEEAELLLAQEGATE